MCKALLELTVSVLPPAVNVYVSTDLYNWTPAGVAINSSLYISRPKVLHNERTGQFILWCKATPSAAAFVASSPLGPFNLVYHGGLAERQVGGLTVYQDVQHPESAWLIYSAKPTATLPRAMMVLPLSSNWCVCLVRYCTARFYSSLLAWVCVLLLGLGQNHKSLLRTLVISRVQRCFIPLQNVHTTYGHRILVVGTDLRL